MKMFVLAILFCICSFGYAARWQKWQDKTQGFIVTKEGNEVWFLDPAGVEIALRNNENIPLDDLTYDLFAGTFWTTREQNHSDIYNFGYSLVTGDIFLIDRIRYSDDAGKELEGVVADPYDGTLWMLDDTGDQTTLIHAERTGLELDADNDYDEISNVSIYNVNPTLGVASGQGITYDTRTGTLWITSNVGNRVYNYTTAGVLKSSFLLSLSGTTNAKVQGIYHDYSTDTLWIAERDFGFRNITTSGMLIRTLPNVPGSPGPTGISLIPRWFAPLAPRLWYKMDDAAAQKVIVDEQNFNIGGADDNVTSVAGRNGTGLAIDFEADDFQFITFTDTIDLTKEFAISFWIKFESLQGVMLGQVATNNEWIRLESDSDISIKTVAGGTENYQTGTHGFTFETGTWMHIVLQRVADGRFIVYKNGVAAAAESGVNTGAFAATGFGLKDNNSSAIDAVVDEYMLFDHMLSANEILRIYNNGVGIDDTFDLTAPSITEGGYRSRYSDGVVR